MLRVPFSCAVSFLQNPCNHPAVAIRPAFPPAHLVDLAADGLRLGLGGVLDDFALVVLLVFDHGLDAIGVRPDDLALGHARLLLIERVSPPDLAHHGGWLVGVERPAEGSRGGN